MRYIVPYLSSGLSEKYGFCSIITQYMMYMYNTPHNAFPMHKYSCYSLAIIQYTHNTQMYMYMYYTYVNTTNMESIGLRQKLAIYYTVKSGY